uniref:amylo-alpha-1,6-glucosidase n=1 Tax=Deinococcus sp. TaxID=47478 RepID=UPI0025BC1462
LYEVSARHSVTLTLGGFFTDRDMHALHAQAPNLVFQTGGKWAKVQGTRSTAVRLHLPKTGQQRGPVPGQSVLQETILSALTPAPFAQRVHYRTDTLRGEVDTEYVRGCALWRVTFPPGGGRVALSVQGVTPTTRPVKDPWQAYDTEAERRLQLARLAFQSTGVADEVVATLAVAADAYIVKRTQPAGVSVIAGYPWFGEWGRDAMVALTGLTLVTGRPTVARDLIRTFLHTTQRGLAPNFFHDDGSGAGYNTVDAALWLAVCLERYTRTTGDGAFVRECLPALREILGWHVQGTDFGIQVDPDDGLLRCGLPGSQLTWMDAKINDWVVTPRAGKPVEIQALWLAALGAEVRLSGALGETPRFADVLERAWQGFGALWQHLPGETMQTGRTPLAELLGLSTTGPGGLTGLVSLGDPSVSAPALEQSALDTINSLGDVQDNSQRPATHSTRALLADGLTPQGTPDLSVRPNAVVALALADTPVSDAQLDAVIAQTEELLLTPMGLRSLSPLDPNYRGHYGGPQIVRDAAYHQGTVWPWTIGSFTELLVSRGEVRRARAVLAGLTGHLWEAGIGHVSEIFSAEDQRAAGCPFQAWSVAEVLRAHVLVSLSEQRLAQPAQKGPPSPPPTPGT